jgi:protein FAM32A
MADAYREVVGGSLKLKLGVADGGVKKKKKKKKLDKEAIEKELQVSSEAKDTQKTSNEGVRPKTAAEKAFEKVQRERQAERILKKASKSHKQRVEEFNDHLDTLSEHYDIPKVSWTK